MPIEQTDWNEIWNRQLAEVSGMHNTTERWNLYAPIFNNFTNSENFSSQILPHLDISPEDSVLDIGCGTGGLTIPIAQKSSQVTALDLSPEMLKLLQQNVKSSGIRNLTVVCRPWESVKDQDIPVYDVVIASRSIGMENIGTHILKMYHHAKKRVYLVWRSGKRSFDAAIHEAIGREYHEYPGYDVLYNILHSLGFFPTVRVFQTTSRLSYPDMSAAQDHWRWKLAPLSPHEEAGIHTYLHQNLKKAPSGQLETGELPGFWVLMELKKSDAE